MLGASHYFYIGLRSSLYADFESNSISVVSRGFPRAIFWLV